MTFHEGWRQLAAFTLTWPEADPERHPFDAAEAAAVVRALAPPPPPRPTWGDDRHAERAAADRWRDATSRALAERYGRWAVGWCWTVGEGDWDGGPVGAWCCVSHSISAPDATLELVAEALVEWREWLEYLAGHFHRHLPLSGGDPRTAWELAVVQLVNATVDRTGNESGWYGHCAQVLTWFLTAAGVAPEHHASLVRDAIGGVFRSWVQPSRAEVDGVAARFADAVVPGAERAPEDDWPDTWPAGWPSPRATNLVPTPERPRDRLSEGRPDDLSAWFEVRAALDWNAAAGHVAGPVRSGHDAIAQHVASRAELSAALGQARDDAARGGPLTFARLARWQTTVLDVPEAGFRTGPAWAKGGRERYHWREDLAERFESCLAEATDDTVPLPSRAARVYLDVAFFHPFDDGNARAAMLALYYVLARDGVVLDRCAPLLMTVRRAHDQLGAAGLARLIEMFVESTARNQNPAP